VANYFLSLPTSFFLKPDVVDELKAAAHTLLHQNSEFKKLLMDLGAQTNSPASGTPGMVK
jgi:hypothetical protein